MAYAVVDTCSFARSRFLDQAQELHALWRDRGRCFIAGCKHDGLVKTAVQQQAGQQLPLLLVQYVSTVDHDKSQALLPSPEQFGMRRQIETVLTQRGALTKGRDERRRFDELTRISNGSSANLQV